MNKEQFIILSVITDKMINCSLFFVLNGINFAKEVEVRRVFMYNINACVFLMQIIGAAKAGH